MSIEVSDQLKKLRWYKVSTELVNIRQVSSASAHPISVVEAIIKYTSSLAFPGVEKDSQPNIFFHITGKSHTYKIRQGDRLPVEIIFTRCSSEQVSQWRRSFAEYLATPEGGINYQISVLGDIEERNIECLCNDRSFSTSEICLQFAIPLPFTVKKGRDNTYIDKQQFVELYEKRFKQLFGEDVLYKNDGDDFSILPYYWRYTEIKHASVSRSGTTQYINGCVGPLYIKGAFKSFIPLLLLGSELHTGTKLPNSQGYYSIPPVSPAYFHKFFPAIKALLPVVNNVLETNDAAAESIAGSHGMNITGKEYAETLCTALAQETYLSSPNTAFTVRKKDGTNRLIESLHAQDLIVHQYVFKTIAETLDRFFEEGSIGFRKGISRQKAVEMVQSALAEGYTYVIESDIEDFFPSVELDVLEGLLENSLPEEDRLLKNLLKKLIHTGYVLDGSFVERNKGLAQGSPLSPLLANLYLDSFDEQAEQWNVKMIRYADDFIILTKTKEDATEVLSKTEVSLSKLGLKIKKKKTSIVAIKDGFQFLGIKFAGSEAAIEPEENLRKFRKPLYITEPFLFLSLNGEALDIRRQGKVIETIPVRRISEIIVMEKASFSTALMRKCTEENIPLTVTLNSGYYITTVKPDSKRYYDISFRHGQKYSSLTETEILSFAKEFAAAKIKNYVALFRQKFKKGQYRFLNQLEGTAKDIYAAATVNEVRGYEGIAAKNIYKNMNDLIDNPSFHIKKRDRKNPDRINSLINFGHYLMFSRINATVRAMGLNPYLGFLHAPADDYESFVCDVQELFRARIDRFLIRIINLKVIAEQDFVETDRGAYLTHEAKVKFLDKFEYEMERKGSEELLPLSDEIYTQIYLFKKWVFDGTSPTFYNWRVQ
ncbi:MAG: CRISPR-associated endonuclease Cas1 [Bacteroidota bacterium]